MTEVPSVPQFLLMAFCRVHILTEFLCIHHLGLPLFISSTVMQSGMSVYDSIDIDGLCKYPAFLDPCLSLGCVWIAG